jgi:hypothetical protein
MELITILNRCHRFRGFGYQHAHFSPDKKSIEVAVRPRTGSAAVCSRCHLPAPGTTSSPSRRFEYLTEQCLQRPDFALDERIHRKQHQRRTLGPESFEHRNRHRTCSHHSGDSGLAGLQRKVLGALPRHSSFLTCSHGLEIGVWGTCPQLVLGHPRSSVKPLKATDGDEDAKR